MHDHVVALYHVQRIAIGLLQFQFQRNFAHAKCFNVVVVFVCIAAVVAVINAVAVGVRQCAEGN